MSSSRSATCPRELGDGDERSSGCEREPRMIGAFISRNMASGRLVDGDSRGAYRGSMGAGTGSGTCRSTIFNEYTLGLVTGFEKKSGDS